MPTPRKNETKSNFLQRCASFRQEVEKQEETWEESYAACAWIWEEEKEE